MLPSLQSRANTPILRVQLFCVLMWLCLPLFARLLYCNAAIHSTAETIYNVARLQCLLCTAISVSKECVLNKIWAPKREEKEKGNQLLAPNWTGHSGNQKIGGTLSAF